MAKAFIFRKIVASKAPGSKAKLTAKASVTSKMELSKREHTDQDLEGSGLVKICMKMGKCIQVSSLMRKRMGLEGTALLMVSRMKENGKMIYSMVKEFNI